jgi:hypothetical protein
MGRLRDIIAAREDDGIQAQFVDQGRGRHPAIGQRHRQSTKFSKQSMPALVQGITPFGGPGWALDHLNPLG